MVTGQPSSPEIPNSANFTSLDSIEVLPECEDLKSDDDEDNGNEDSSSGNATLKGTMRYVLG